MSRRSTVFRAFRLMGVGLMVGSVVGSLALFPAQPGVAAPAAADDAKADPDQVLIHDATAPQTYQFTVPVPEDGQLRALPSEKDANRLTQEILVVDATGKAVGAYDEPWAHDAAGRFVPTSYRIEGNTLVQTVEFGPYTAFPVVIDPSYSSIGEQGGGMVPLGYVGIPSNYVYNPSLGALHDYCTSSPDEFPNPAGANANFRGPCARHDLCYAGSTSEFVCDNVLRDQMRENCRYYYAWYNPVRQACYYTANIYWAAVVAA